MKQKPDWKQRAIQAENELQAVKVTIGKDCLGYEKKINELRIERDAAERRYQEMVVKAEMPKPKTWPKPCPFDIALFILWLPVVIGLGWTAIKLEKLQIPILSPYPVQITKWKAPVFVDDWGTVDKLKACQDAWRADEKVIHKLQREIK